MCCPNYLFMDDAQGNAVKGVLYHCLSNDAQNRERHHSYPTISVALSIARWQPSR